MKKSVVILIALIYIASIALVGFFGLKFKIFEEVVYVSSIEFLNDDILDAPEGIEDFDCYVVIKPDENGNRKYQIEYRVFPDNASKKGAIFSYDKDSAAEAGITVDEFGVVTFTRQGAITIVLIPEDGGDAASKRLAIFSY